MGPIESAQSKKKQCTSKPSDAHFCDEKHEEKDAIPVCGAYKITFLW
jgi:hypothetical protein